MSPFQFQQRGLLEGWSWKWARAARTHARKRTHKRQKTEIVEKWIVKKKTTTQYSLTVDCILYFLIKKIWEENETSEVM